MGDFEWIGRFKQHKPDKLYEYIARRPGVRASVFSEAKKVGTRAEAILAGHRDRGHSRIKVEKGTLADAFVVLDDTRGKGAAAAIEFGHMKRDGSHVPGVAPLRKAASSG